MACRQECSMPLSVESERRESIFIVFGRIGTFHLGALGLVVLSLLAVPARSTAQGSQPEKRRVVVSDAIQMTRLADDSYLGGGSSKGRVATYSPDGKRFVVVLRKGNLETNTDEFSVYLFESSEAFHTPKATVVLQMASSSNRGAVRDIKWLSDNETIAFVGEHPGEVSQVYTFNVRTRHLAKRTDHPTGIIKYDISGDGGEIVFAAAVPRKAINTEQARNEGIIISNQVDLANLLVEGESATSGEDELFLQKPGQLTLFTPVNDAIFDYGQLSVSPDGRYVLVESFVRDVPSGWKDYQNSVFHSLIQPLRFGRYLLLETKESTLTPLLDAPMDPFKGDPPLWGADGHSVFLKGMCLPLDVKDPVQREERKKTMYDIELKLPSKEFRKVLPGQGPTLDNTHPGLDVTLEEDVNTPPRIYASNEKTHETALLFDLNPQFGELKFGKVEIINWKTTVGNEVQGGLYLPPDYSPGKRYPLVIQTHGFLPKRFSIDGRLDWSSGFAAQPLAAKGIVVVQAAERAVGSIQEAPSEMARYEGVIEYLDGRGLIDRNRVGIVGFSGTVYHVAYTLTHSKYNFSAAILVDGVNNGYFQLLADPFVGEQFDAQNGGSPFGAGLKAWMKNSPGFNLDKVRTPVRLQAHSRGAVLAPWEWFSGLSLLHKPVELVELPDAEHLLVKPWDRRIAMQGIVDWFSFWLKGEEDPHPAKAEQYARWRELRKMQAENEAKAKATAVN